MKKAVILLGSLLTAASLALGGYIFYARANQPEPDKTGNSNINVMLARPDNWRQIAAGPVISRSELSGIIDGSTATIPITAELLRQFYGLTDAEVQGSPEVQHATTHTAYECLLNPVYREKISPGLILVTPPSAEELALAEQNGVEMELVPVAADGFVFITHKDNPVDSLTVKQIRDIYRAAAGTITNWSQVGGQNKAIRAYQREQNSGSQTAMEQLVMAGRRMRPPIKAEWYSGMGGLVDAVAEYENGPASIGYTYYYYINNLYKNENIKILHIDGVEPNNENFISGAYPFTTAYYAVIRSDEPENSPARRLRDYLISPEGQEIIEMAGYCRAGEG